MADQEDVDLELGEEESKGGSKLMLIIIIVVVLIVGAGAAVFFMGLGPFAASEESTAEGEGSEAATEQPVEVIVPTIYYSMDDPMVINLAGGGKSRYLQLRIQFLVATEEDVERITKHTPVIRNNLYFLIGEKTYAELRSAESKELVRQEVLAEVREILTERTGKASVEDLFFYMFVVQ